MLSDDGVVVDEQPGRFRAELERHSARDVIEDVANEIDGAAERGLCAIAAVRRIDAAVVEDADVMDGAVCLDEIVAHHMNVVIVDVDRRGTAVRVLFGSAVIGDTDGVVEISDGIVCDNVARPVNLHRVVAGQEVGAVRTRLAHSGPVRRRDESGRRAQGTGCRRYRNRGSRSIGPDTRTHIFEPAILNREADCAEDFFLTGENRDIGVSEREALEEVMARGHHVEERALPSPSRTTSPSPRGLNGNGFLGVPLSVSDIQPSNGVIIGST